MDDTLKILETKEETINIFLDPIKHPVIFARKVQCLMSGGNTEEAAIQDVLNTPLQMELFYDIGRGLFLVEAEAVTNTDIFNPYTGELIPEEEE